MTYIFVTVADGVLHSRHKLVRLLFSLVFSTISLTLLCLFV